MIPVLLLVCTLVVWRVSPNVVDIAWTAATRTMVVRGNGHRVSLQETAGEWRLDGAPVGDTAHAIEAAVERLGVGTSTPLDVELDGVRVHVERKRAGSVVVGRWAWTVSGRVTLAGVSSSQGDALGDAFAAAGVRVT